MAVFNEGFQQIIRKQDEHLIAIDASVSRLAETTHAINTELDTQTSLLDQTISTTTEAQHKLDRSNASILKLIKSKFKPWCCIVLGLSVTAVGLLIWILI